MKIKPTEGSYRKAAVLIDTKPTTRQTKFKNNALAELAAYINDKSLPLMLSHNTDKLPSGRWYEAKVDEQNQVITKFFIPQEVNEFTDIKTRIETGLLDSASLGFSASVHDCSICGNDINDYENCSHIPGKTYDGEECYVMLDKITPVEASLVYSGAVPNAKIKPGDAEQYAACDCKKDFCDKFSFEEGDLEIVTSGKILQDTTQNKDKGTSMELQVKFDSLLTNYNDMAVKFATLNKEKLDLAAELSKLKTDNQAFATISEDKDEAVKLKEEAITSRDEMFSNYSAAVEKLAAPFEAEYKAPDNFEDLSKDFEKYMEKTRALPAGRQSQNGEDTKLEFSVNDEIFRSR